MSCTGTFRGAIRRWSRFVNTGAVSLSIVVGGCAGPHAAVQYVGSADHQFYKSVATEIDHPALMTESPDSVAFTEPPKTIADDRPTEIWDLPLTDAIRVALENNEVIRSNGTFLAGGGVLNNVNGVTSVYDPAIQETSIQLGQGGVESALAAFDPSFSTSMFWSRDESFNNFGGLSPGATVSELGNFNATLSKVFGTGASLALGHSVNYGSTLGGIPGAGAGLTPPSGYTGNTALQFRQPLLAGSGVDFTRIAGPTNSPTSQLSSVTNGFLGGGAASGAANSFTQQLSGVSNGVVIARINNDISITQFETAVRDMIRDVEDVYWDLYLAYRNFDTAVVQRNSALKTWQISKIQRDLEGDILPASEAQARDQYFASDAQVDSARSRIFEIETRLRRLMSLPVNDGRVIRPLTSPVTAKIVSDWYACLSEALEERPELRAHKWQVKSLQLQVKAADTLVRPSLDFVAGYQINGVGDQLLGYDNPGGEGSIDGPTFYESQVGGNLSSWQLGVAMSTPIGLRRANSQVRNLELRLAKAQKALATAEHEISQELANAFQQLARTQANMQSQFSRREAAIENVELLEPLWTQGEITLDELLRAQARRATAEDAFFESVVSYNKALANLQYRKGTLLEYDNVILTEGPWSAEAHYWANRRSNERAHAKQARWVEASPAPFASNFNVDPVEVARPTKPMPAAEPTWSADAMMPPAVDDSPARIDIETSPVVVPPANSIEPPANVPVSDQPPVLPSVSNAAHKELLQPTAGRPGVMPSSVVPSSVVPAGIQRVGYEETVLKPMPELNGSRFGGGHRPFFVE